ncbi:hypothetical protein SEPCBS119000_004568 [Sporothrix epigloea]|uniref:F-box domain-containing protein n=1 Tax=Sporothrix epigloea TaxID=1892477 RepID=A0ABP0DT05_9PEZI
MTDVDAGPSLAPGQDRLARLPLEILLHITRQLNTADYGAVRLCSRTLEHSLRYFFLNEYFQCKQFMLTELSLQRLLAFAQHPDISQTLCNVTIGVEGFCRGYKNHPEDEELATTLIMLAADQKALMANGRAVQMLSAAFSLLPNLVTVRLRDGDSCMQFPNGSYASWSSYGLRHMRQQLGGKAEKLLTTAYSPDFSSRAFSLVVAALAQTKTRPPILDVAVKMRQCALNYQAFDLTPAPRLYVQGGSGEDGVNVYAYAVLAGLRRLQLTLQCGYHPQEQESGEFVVGVPPFKVRAARAFAEYLPVRAWLAHCPNIEWLCLNLLEEACIYNNEFLNELYSPLPDFYSLPPASPASRDITMPFASHLRRFGLGTASCNVDVLLELLGRFPALEHLSLRDFSLVYETRNPPTVWKDFLVSLVKSPLGAQLKHLSLTRVGTAASAENYPRMFKTHGLTFNGLDSVEYNAKAEKSMAFWLQNMVVRIVAEPGVYDTGLGSGDSDEFDYGTFADWLSDSEYGSDAEQEGDGEHEANGEGEDNVILLLLNLNTSDNLGTKGGNPEAESAILESGV